MSVRRSDFTALAAIATGVVLSTAAIAAVASRQHHDTGFHHGAVHGETGEAVIFYERAVEDYDAALEVLEECTDLVVEEQEVLSVQRAFLLEQLALQEAELESVREATRTIKLRVQNDIRDARRQLDADESGSWTVMVGEAEADLVRFTEAEQAAERAQVEMMQNIEERLQALDDLMVAGQEAVVTTYEDADRKPIKKRKRHRKHPPCRRPGKRHPRR